MPIADEHQGGVRRFAIFTFVVDDQGGAAGAPALRFPQSPHSSSLEVSTRLRHCESFFMKRMKSLEKGFIFPFVDVSFFSTFQHTEEMKRLIEPRDCVNFHDPGIHLQKGCYEEVQLVDPKRDMIQTPIDDDDIESPGSNDAVLNDSKAKPKIVHPPGIHSGSDDHKKTRGFILIAYKTMEYMYSREFLSSWKTWTGVRYICMQMPRQLGLRRIAFYRQLSCTSDFSYVLLIEVSNLLLYAAQTLNLMDRIKLRLCGCAGVFRETDFQVDPVTANVHHITTTYRPPEKPFSSALGSTLGRLDSGDSLGSTGQTSRKASQALTNGTNALTAANATPNVDTLMQLLKQQKEAAARRKASMEAPNRAKKRHSLAPPDYPAPSLPQPTTSTVLSIPEVSELKTETSKKAPRAQPESEDSSPDGEIANSSASTEAMQKIPKIHTTSDKRGFPQQQPPQIVTQHQMYQQQQPAQQSLQSQPRPIYHSTAPLYPNPIEISTAISTSIPQQHPYFAHYHQTDTLPMYGHILSQPIDTLLQNRQPLQEMITSDYHPVYTYTGQPVQNSPFGYVQPTGPRTPPDYNSPVYTRNEWKRASTVYGGQGDESIRNLAEQFRTLRETPIIGSDPYLLSSTSGTDDGLFNAYRHGFQDDEDGDPYLEGMHRERSRSAAFLEDPRRVFFQNLRNHTLPPSVLVDRVQDRKVAKSDALQRKMQEAERLQKKIVEAGKFMEAEKLQQKIAEAENLQQKIAEAERLQQKIVEAERIQQKLAMAEKIQHQQMAADTDRPKQKKEEKSHRDRGEKAPHRQKSTPKLENMPELKESPTFSPKRRTLPKLPAAQNAISDEEMEVDTKRHTEKKDRSQHQTQKQSQHRPSAKEAVEEQPVRHRPRDGANGEKTKQKELTEKAQQNGSNLLQLPNQEQASTVVQKPAKPAPVTRSRHPENGGDTKSRQISGSTDRKSHSPTGATAVPPSESNGRHEKPRGRETQSRSRSREDPKGTAMKGTVTQEGAPTSSGGHHQKQKPPESVNQSTGDQQATRAKSPTVPNRNRHSPSKSRQSPKKRK